MKKIFGCRGPATRPLASAEPRSAAAHFPAPMAPHTAVASRGCRMTNDRRGKTRKDNLYRGISVLIRSPSSCFDSNDRPARTRALEIAEEMRGACGSCWLGARGIDPGASHSICAHNVPWLAMRARRKPDGHSIRLLGHCWKCELQRASAQRRLHKATGGGKPV